MTTRSRFAERAIRMAREEIENGPVYKDIHEYRYARANFAF